MRTLVLAAIPLGLVTLSDGFLYLALQRRMNFDWGIFPLLYVATALVYFLLAVPAGYLADRVGRGWVLLSGYALLPIIYTILLRPAIGAFDLTICLLLFGAYYAATDGVLMALGSAILPAALRSSGLALLSTATSLARLLSSVLFGTLWTWLSMESALLLFGVGLLAAVLFAAPVLIPLERGIRSQQAAV